MFPTFISILDIQSWWEVPSIAHFCSLFRTAFKLLDFDIEDLEEALLTDGTEEASWLQELIVLLLKGCLQEHDISLFNYQMFLRRLFRKKCEEYAIINPFNTDIDFELLPLRVKVEILYNLCEFRLDAPDVLDELKNLEADSLRVEPIGYDSKKSAYWYFYGTRLYREDFPKSEKSIWQVVCFTITDWVQLVKKLENANSKAELSLYKTLKKNFIPELPRLFLEKETIARRRLLEAKRCSQDDSLIIKEDYYTHILREDIKRHEINRRLVRKSFQLLDDQTESRYEMGKSKDKKSKDEAIETKDAKPVGRQTNNSLASATGQILIQQVSNPNKKKMKTSQVFNQSEEDLQTGLHKILDHVKEHEDAWPFIEPVEEEYAPNYYSIIRKPMDLQKMEERLENGHYKTFSKFKTDFQLIVNNCKLYNGVDNEYSEMVDTVLEVFNRAVERYLDQVTSSDDEIAVEYPDPDKTRKKRHEGNHKSKKQTPSPDIKKKHKSSSVFEEVEEDFKTHKKKKDKDEKRDKSKEDTKEKKGKSAKLKKNKDKEKENKKIKEVYEDEESCRKAKKRKADVLEDNKSKKEERQVKMRKEEAKEVKELKIKNKSDEKCSRKIEKDKSDKAERKLEKHKKSKEVDTKYSKKQEGLIAKKHGMKKIEAQKNAEKADRAERKSKKSNKKLNHSSRRSRSTSPSSSFSRSRSRSLEQWSSSPPPSSPPSSSESIIDSAVKYKKKAKKEISKSEVKNIDSKDKIKSKHDKWKDLFKEEKSGIGRADNPNKPKDKHHTLRETIEKLKAKSDLNKLKVEKDLKIYDFPNEGKEGKVEANKDASKKRKDAITSTIQKKRKLNKDNDGNNTAESVHSETKSKSTKKPVNCTNNSKKFDALSLATEQTLKDINKWLDDTPKFPEFSSASNSPSHFSGIDDFDNNTNKSSDLEKKKSESTASRKDPTCKDKDISINSSNGAMNASANVKKRPLNRDPTKIFRRKEVQRTIDRLQPGKSKGNLITNVQKDTKQEELFALGPLSKIKDTKNSLIVKTDDSAPKLSLGSVLDSFGKHKFIDDDNKKDEEGESVLKSEDKRPVEDSTVDDKVKCDDVIVDSPKLDNSPGAATPNLSAWFKAFGGPKLQSATKKTEGTKEEKVDGFVDNKKEEPKKVSLPDLSPNPDSPLMHGQPTPRQRKVSTGSSMSERSSFSQDMDSPRVGIDERLGAYPAPYPSPLHKSPSGAGASPSLRSPLPDVSPKSSAYPFNGQMRVGFYQDTVSTKSSPDKACSPRDNPQSPYTHYSEHVYTPPTTQNANYSYNNPYYQPSNYSPSNPTPPYNTESNPPLYYDTTKPLTDQYQAKNQDSSAAQQPPSQQRSPLMSQPNSPNVPSQASPIDVQQFQQPHSPIINQQQQMHSLVNPQQVQDTFARQTQSQSPVQQLHSPQPHPQTPQHQPIPQQHTHPIQPQQVPAVPQQEKFMYNTQQMQPQISPMDANAYRTNMDYVRQQGPPNVEPFRSQEPKLLQPNNSYPVKKRAYNEIEQSRNYDETQYNQTRELPKYIHQNIPEPRSLSTQGHPPQQGTQSNPVQQQNASNQFPPTTYNYPVEATHQYPPLNIPSAGRSVNPMPSIEDSRKTDISKYTNMGYTGADINVHLSRNPYKQQSLPNQPETISQQQQRFAESNTLNMDSYKSQVALPPQGNPVQATEGNSNYKPEVSVPRPTYHNNTQLEMDPSLSLRGLSHIVDRYPNEESRMLALQAANQPPSYYSDKNLPGQHMFPGKSISTGAALPMFSQPSSMSPYGAQGHQNMYNRQMTDLQVPLPQSQQTTTPQQQQASRQQHTAPPAPEPKPKKKRLTKAAKAAAAAAAAQAAQQTSANNLPQVSESGQGFQSYAGLKTSTSSMEPSAISLKTASVVPGSAFNFGPSTTGLSLPSGLYGDKESFPNFLDDFRTAPNYYMAAAAAAHHRSPPENPDKSSSSRVSAHQASNPSSVSVPSTVSYPFIGSAQGRPPTYPLPGVPGAFMPPHQAPLMDTSSPQYLQYLQAGVLHQGLLPPGAYASGYHPALSIRQPYDSMTRPPWL